MNKGAIDADPSTTLKDALEPPKPRHFAAPTDPGEVSGILRALESAGVAGAVAQCALMLHLPDAVRPGELARPRWADFDFAAREWRFISPKRHVPHVVPLSRQALAMPERVKAFSLGRSEWVFPSGRGLARPMSNGAMTATLKRTGIGPEVLVPHG